MSPTPGVCVAHPDDETFAPTPGDDVWRRRASRGTHVMAPPPREPGAPWSPDVVAGRD